jgi:hypothetical protein
LPLVPHFQYLRQEKSYLPYCTIFFSRSKKDSLFRLKFPLCTVKCLAEIVYNYFYNYINLNFWSIINKCNLKLYKNCVPVYWGILFTPTWFCMLVKQSLLELSTRDQGLFNLLRNEALNIIQIFVLITQFKNYISKTSCAI